MDATGQSQAARAFGWELAELMLDALRPPSSTQDSAAFGHHAADVIEEQARSLADRGEVEDVVRLWADAACWGFRDRMAIAHELADPDGKGVLPTPIRGLGPDDEAVSPPPMVRHEACAATPEAAAPETHGAPAKPKARTAKPKPRLAAAKSRRRAKPAPVA